ncbi:hypothetical protein B0O80DRAFT_421016 [Mortierella sp. GBAus27b]|nr:hypothetical protein BGX31_004061 [Mortierella sp. GBA43]KAI8363253.1 hypothetical protein B0O80DRAFT_421016 [Mortierella sp. GBAus27b]
MAQVLLLELAEIFEGMEAGGEALAAAETAEAAEAAEAALSFGAADITEADISLSTAIQADSSMVVDQTVGESTVAEQEAMEALKSANEAANVYLIGDTFHEMDVISSERLTAYLDMVTDAAIMQQPGLSIWRNPLSFLAYAQFCVSTTAVMGDKMQKLVKIFSGQGGSTQSVQLATQHPELKGAAQKICDALVKLADITRDWRKFTVNVYRIRGNLGILETDDRRVLRLQIFCAKLDSLDMFVKRKIVPAINDASKTQTMPSLLTLNKLAALYGKTIMKISEQITEDEHLMTNHGLEDHHSDANGALILLG